MKLWNAKESEDPIKRMVEFVESAQKGDYSATLPVSSPGEVGELERSLNRLVAELRENRDRWEEQKAIQKELKVSRGIQKTLLPNSTPDIPGIEIHALYKPAKQVGGDYYDFIDVDQNHLGIVVADVAGKSISAAMLMTITRNTLRQQAMLSLSPMEVLERTQRFLLPNMAAQFFVSMFYAVFDKRTHLITCANAGHPPLLWYNAQVKKCEWVRPEGIAIGLSRNGGRPVCREEKELTLEKGDMLFFYTDGIPDTTNVKGATFGRERIAQLAETAAPKGGRQFLTALETDLAAFGRDADQTDDMTAIVMSRKGGGSDG